MIYSKKELEYLSSSIELLNKEILETRGEVFTWLNAFQITVSDDVINKISKEAYGYILPGLIKNINEDNLLELLNTYYKGNTGKIEITCQDICEIQYQFLGENNKSLNNYLKNLIKSNEIGIILDTSYADFLSLNKGFEKEVKTALNNKSFIDNYNFETIDIIVNNKKIKNNEEFIKVIKLLFNRYGRIGRYELSNRGLNLENFPEEDWISEDELLLNDLITEKDYFKYIKKSGIFNGNQSLTALLIEKINMSRNDNSEKLLSLKEIKDILNVDKDNILDVALSNYGLYLNNENESFIKENWSITSQDIANKLQESITGMINNTVINNITHSFKLKDEIFKSIITEDFLNKFLMNENNIEPSSSSFNDFMSQDNINKSVELLSAMNNIIKNDIENNNLSINKSLTYLLLTRDFINEAFTNKNTEYEKKVIDLIDLLITSIDDIKKHLGEDFELVKQYIRPLDEKKMINLRSDMLENKNLFNQILSFGEDSKSIVINGVVITIENYSENKVIFLNLLKKVESNNLYMPNNIGDMIKEMSDYKASAELFEDIVKNDIKILEKYSRTVRDFIQKNFLDDYKKEAISYLNKGKEVFKKSNDNTYVDLMSKTLQYLKKEDRCLLLDDVIEKNIYDEFIYKLKNEPGWLFSKVDYIPIDMEMDLLKKLEDNKDYDLLAMWILSLEDVVLNNESKDVYSAKIESLFQYKEIRESLYNIYDKFLISISENERVHNYLSKEKLKVFNNIIQTNNYESSLLIDYYTDMYNNSFRSIEELLKGKNIVTSNEDILKKRFYLLSDYIRSSKDFEKLIINIIENKDTSGDEIKLYLKLKDVNVADFSKSFYHEVERSEASDMIKLFVNEKSKTTLELNTKTIKSLINQVKNKLDESREYRNIFANLLLKNDLKNNDDLKNFCFNDNKVLELINENLNGFRFEQWFNLIEGWIEKDSFEELCELFKKLEDKNLDKIMNIVLDTYKKNYLHTNPEFLIKIEKHNLIKNNSLLESFKIPQKNKKVSEWLRKNEDVQAYFEKYIMSLNINNQEKKISKKIKF